MAAFVARRLVVSALTLLLSTFIVYQLVAISGDPLADLRTDTSPNRDQKIAHRIAVLHLDQSPPRRYFTWLQGVAQCAVPGMRCTFGTNLRDQDVSTLLGQAMGTTVRLITAAVVLAIVLGVAVGVVSSLRQYSGFDYSITFSAFLFYSLPVFWVAVLLKQYLAIGVNDWYDDPHLSLTAATVIAVLAGLTAGGVLGGDRRRRWIARGTGAVVAAVAVFSLETSGWLKAPAIGPALIAVLSFGAAVGFAYLTAGLGRRAVLYSCLATAGTGSVVQFWVTPWLQNPLWASWLNVVLLLLVACVVATAFGYALGGLDRGPAIRASLLTAVVTGGLIVTDLILRAVPVYSKLVSGRILATIGSETPNLKAAFWPQQLDVFTHLLLPTLTIMLISFATYSRYSRATMLEVMHQDYVRTARAKGLTERTVVIRHAFRNALIPVTTLAALDFGALIGGAVITEYVFGWQGMGSLFIIGLLDTDPNPVMAFYLVTAVSVVVFNLLADLAYAYLDPRIRIR